MDSPKSVRVGVADRVGQHHVDAVRVPSHVTQILTAAIPGLTPTGALPVTFEAEARRAWTNVRKVLTAAGAGLDDIVSVRTWLTAAADIPRYTTIAREFLDHDPVFFTGVVEQLAWPQMRVQVEVVATVPAREE